MQPTAENRKALFPRLHLFEFEDLEWLPRNLRVYITDLLTYQIANFGIYDAASPTIARILKQTGLTSILDLCSGSGGPAPGVAKSVSEVLGKDVFLYLTDKYPNKQAFKAAKNSTVTPIFESIDATDVPSNLKGMRTLFTAFHHFKPNKAKKILQNALDSQMPIGVFEITERRLNSFMTLLLAPITCFIFSLFVRPRKFGRFFWTYLLPIVPCLYTWDGMISNLRTYTKSEWLRMAEGLDHNNFRWEVGELTSKFHIKVSYLIGYPEKKAE